jgi:hypothetical protein
MGGVEAAGARCIEELVEAAEEAEKVSARKLVAKIAQFLLLSIVAH